MLQAQDLVFNENVLLQTLGFDVAIDHPHTHVVRTCHLVKGEPDDDLRQIHAARQTQFVRLRIGRLDRAILNGCRAVAGRYCVESRVYSVYLYSVMPWCNFEVF